MGSQAQDGENPTAANTQACQCMASTKAASSGQVAAQETLTGAQWALCLLCPHRESTVHAKLALAGNMPVAQMAESALLERTNAVGEVQQTATALPVAPSPCRTHSQYRSKTMNRGAVCGSSARTDLWEPRGGNNPGPPGHRVFTVVCKVSPEAIRNQQVWSSNLLVGSSVYLTDRPSHTVEHHLGRPAHAYPRIPNSALEPDAKARASWSLGPSVRAGDNTTSQRHRRQQ